MASSIRKKILVLYPTGGSAFPFSQSRAFEDLARSHDLYLAYIPKGNFIEEIDTTSFKETYKWELDAKREKGLRSWMMFLNMWGHRHSAKPFGDSFRRIFLMDHCERNPFHKLFYYYIPGFSARLTTMILTVLEKWIGEEPALAKIVDELKPDLMVGMLCGYSAYDMEPVKIANNRKIPVLYLQVGWDNIPHRGLLRPNKPDYLGVWGYQSAMFAELIQDIPKRRIFMMGSPLGEVLRKKPEISREEILRKLNVPSNKKVLFFAGVSHVGNEVGILDMLEKWIEEGKLPDCCIFYRPHPYRQFTKNEPNFFERNYKHIYLDPKLRDRFKRHVEDKQTMTSLGEKLDRNYAYNREILSISSILVAPISTFVIEALSCEVPSVLIAFVGKSHEKYNIRYDMATNQFYHAVPGVFNAFSPDDLLSKCHMALNFKKDEKNLSMIRSHLNSISYQDEQTIGERITRAVDSIFSLNGTSSFHYFKDPIIDVERKENVVEDYSK